MVGNLSIVESILEKQFQKKIRLSLKDDYIKEGQFILYRSMLLHNNFYLELHIKTSKKIEMVKIPYPFKTEDHTDENLVLFDYRISSLSSDPQILKILNKFKPIDKVGLNRFYDAILQIEII
jgi:hypothetical protein